MTEPERLDVVIDVLETVIAWMAQSANGPINIYDAAVLLKQLRDAKAEGR